jgi:hypothetical protein
MRLIIFKDKEEVKFDVIWINYDNEHLEFIDMYEGTKKIFMNPDSFKVF